MTAQIGKPEPRESATAMASTAWALLAGWVLVRLVTSGGRPRPPLAERRLAERRRAERRVHAEPGAPPRPDDNHADPDAALADPAAADRGRHAESPTEIPARGWKDIAYRVYEEFNQDHVTSVAAGVTFYALLAIFPAIGALVSIYGLFADPVTIQDHLNTMAGFLPGGAMEIIGEQVQRIASAGSGSLGFAFLFGLGVSLWSANAGMKAIFEALNIVYDEEDKRSFIVLNAVSLAFTFGAILFLLFALGAVVVVPIALDFVGLGNATEWIVRLARWPILLLGIVFALALVYRYGPSRDQPQWRWITPGSVLAAVLWVVVSMLFSWYVSSFGSYNETYGSLGAAIGFMTWIWISTIIILLGAEINAEMEHQTAQDTTEGHRQPLGHRGATMADTVGEAKG
ncbi:YihY/virulence factor BrkB family protein [Microvirga pudoricolor]|uniref:YihY/virulence factor BrkB family protein n=1 Tax=Microvirga pudoricolor TaxID=2778729 RepID=UPI001951CCA1|nr:YihY/virulence factor BrkB family protein [Microvirga pudoricolor]MBM6592944.1 YihY/virulence factor BrkB family protein [Microvirga pudoricolor]